MVQSYNGILRSHYNIVKAYLLTWKDVPDSLWSGKRRKEVTKQPVRCDFIFIKICVWMCADSSWENIALGKTLLQVPVCSAFCITVIQLFHLTHFDFTLEGRVVQIKGLKWENKDVSIIYQQKRYQ